MTDVLFKILWQYYLIWTIYAMFLQYIILQSMVGLMFRMSGWLTN